MADRNLTEREVEAEVEGVWAAADGRESELYKTLKEMSPPSSSQAALEVVQAHNMEEPMCLIENKPGGKLQVNQEALQLLQRIQQPLVVVAIVGLYRTGKSYLMNKLAGKDKGGFSLGSTIEADTKGIWMWCRPHPQKPDHTLVLLDTEGLGDAEKSNRENNSWIFALSVLLSSTFVYNSMGTIGQFALEKLHYVKELTERIQVKAPGRQSREEVGTFPDDFTRSFPSFIWAVCDSTLQLELAGRPISRSGYLNAWSRREAEGVRAPADGHESELYKTLKEVSPPSSSQAALEVVQAHDMEELMCLTENKPGEKLQVNQEAVQLLQRIRQPVVVVAIVGLYWTGKSYLMNKLAGKDKGGSPEKLDFPKKYIHEHFPSRKCFVFDQELRHLEDLPERKLNPEFVEETRHFRSSISETAQAKATPGGPTMTGTYSPEKLDRICIRHYFPCRACFVFDRPASGEGLKNLESLSGSSLSPEIVEDIDNFLQHIYDKPEAKVIQGGHVVTGKLLGNFAVTYVDAIRGGAVPCVENTVLAMARMVAVQEAIKHYEDTMERLLKLPTETVKELLNVHSKCEREAIRVFMARAFNDEDQKYQKELGMTLQSKLQDLCSCNEKASLEHCQAVLMLLFHDLEDKIASGAYLVPGGYRQFINDWKEKLVTYQWVPGKGLMAFKALQDFLTSKESVAQSILMADRNLMNREKEAEVERARAKPAEQRTELHRKITEMTIQKSKEKEESYEEHKRQLMAKMKEDWKNQQMEFEWMWKAKEQEMQRLKVEGLKSEVTRMRKGIQELRCRCRKVKEGKERKTKVATSFEKRIPGRH